MEIRDHALLYALLVKNILKSCGKERGEEIVSLFTKEYGRRRGARMASYSSEKDLNSYFINSEWAGKKGENISRLSFEKDKTVSEVEKCAWFDSWVKEGFEEYGRYYCRYIDEAICQGFNEDLLLNVKSRLSYGDENCVFEWLEAADEKIVLESERKHLLSFDFHCKELWLSAMCFLDGELSERVGELTRKEFEERTGIPLDFGSCG